ncbi:MAG: S49 family peptidase [Legionellales bacterium]|nr:S49 family peptidase [Legionellales bacterium]
MSEISEALAKQILHTLKVKKRWGFLFKILFFIWLFMFLFLLFGSNTKLKEEKPHSALIKIDGFIAESADNNSDSIATSLNNAFSSKSVKGIILRINSPGGSPVTADYIFNEIRRLQKKFPEKKIYAVCSEVCASAAYYIAAAANEIYANPASLVGSISVLYDGFGFVGTLEKLGIERRMVTSGKYKGYLDPYSPLVPEQLDKLKEMLDTLHKQFVKDVQLGRKDKLKDDPDLFSGLYWTGVKALDLGLIDGFSSAGQIAREMIEEPDIVDYTTAPNYWMKFAEKMNFGTKIASALRNLGII